MSKIDRKEQNFLFRHLKLIGWLTTLVALIIFIAGLAVMLVNLFSGMTSGSTSTGSTGGESSDPVQQAINQMQSAIANANDMDSKIISPVKKGLDTMAAGLIMLLITRMVVNGLLLWRAFSDNKKIVPSKGLLITRLVYYPLVIVIELAILISFSVLFPGTVNSYITDLDTVLKTVTESGNIAVSQLQPLNASSSTVDAEIRNIVDNFTNSIKGSLENTSFYSDYKGTINNIVDLMNQQAQPDISQEQIDKISNEIQTNTNNLMNEMLTGIINGAVALIVFNGLWILTDIAYGITAKILVNKNYQGA